MKLQKLAPSPALVSPYKYLLCSALTEAHYSHTKQLSFWWQEALLLVGLTPMAEMGLADQCVRPELQKFCFALRTGN